MSEEKPRVLDKVLVMICSVLAGCQSVGPVTMSRDRLDYSTAILESWKHQTLLNIVKLRYADPPLFVDVGQIVSGYTLETSVDVGLNFGNIRSQNVGGEQVFTDRPTITYVPLTGRDFIAGVVTPIAPASLFSALEVGWQTSVILPLTLAAINGVANEQYISGSYMPADQQFFTVVELFRELFESGMMSINIDRSEDATNLSLKFNDPSGEAREAANEFRELLSLDPEANEYRIEYGDFPTNPNVVFVKTRSLLNILLLMSARAEVPPEHVDSGRATPGAGPGADNTLRGFRIRSSASEVENTFVAVNYRDTWFYVDDRDLGSKSMFGLLMLLFTLADTSEQSARAILTIPAG